MSNNNNKDINTPNIPQDDNHNLSDELDFVVDIVNSPKNIEGVENDNLKRFSIEIDADKLNSAKLDQKSVNIDINIDEKENTSNTQRQTSAPSLDKDLEQKNNPKKNISRSMEDQFNNLKGLISEEKRKSQFIKENIFKKLDKSEDIIEQENLPTLNTQEGESDPSSRSDEIDSSGLASSSDIFLSDKSSREIKPDQNDNPNINEIETKVESSDESETESKLEIGNNSETESSTENENISETKNEPEITSKCNSESNDNSEIFTEASNNNLQSDGNISEVSVTETDTEVETETETESESNSDSSSALNDNLDTTSDKDSAPISDSDSVTTEKDSFIDDMKNNAKIYHKTDAKAIHIPSRSFHNILKNEFFVSSDDNTNFSNQSKNSKATSKKANTVIVDFFNRLKQISEKDSQFEEYSSQSSKTTIKNKLLSDLRGHMINTFIFFILTVLSILVTVLFKTKGNLFHENILAYLAANLGLIVSIIAISHKTLLKSFVALFLNKPNTDLVLSFACVISFFQVIASFFAPQKFYENGLSLYLPSLFLGFLLNSWGKTSKARRIYSNFICLTKPNRELYSASLYQNTALANEMFKGVASYNPVIAFQQKTSFASNFLKLSYEPDPCEKISHKYSIIGIIFSILIGMVYSITQLDFLSGLTVSALILTLSYFPIGVLLLNKPLERLCKKANSLGAIISGYSCIKKFSETNAVALTSKELYSKDSVRIYGIKGFSPYSVDRAILDAASIIISSESPLAPIFKELTKDKLKTLSAVEQMTYYDNLGIEAWVKGHKVLIGNRIIMENHGIAPLSRADEQELAKSTRQLTYIAVSNELLAVMVTSFDPNKSTIKSVQSLEYNGINLLVATEDVNITIKAIAKQFKIFFKSIKILPSVVTEIFIKEKNKILPTSDAYFITTGKTTVFTNLLSSCVRFKSNAIATTVTQIISLILSLIIIVPLLFLFGLEKFDTIKMLFYYIFWFLLSFIVPYIRKF